MESTISDDDETPGLLRAVRERPECRQSPFAWMDVEPVQLSSKRRELGEASCTGLPAGCESAFVALQNFRDHGWCNLPRKPSDRMRNWPATNEWHSLLAGNARHFRRGQRD